MMDETLDNDFNTPPNEEDFQFYKSFHQMENAEEYLFLLKENKIPYRVSSTEALIDEAIVGTGLMPKVVLKILPRDFQKIAYLLEEELNNPDLDLSEHYLHQLNDTELSDIFNFPDQWTEEDGIIAQRLLEQRGHTITREEVRALRAKRFEAIRQGKHVAPTTIGIYFLAVAAGLFIHFIFIIAGITMAFYYMNSKSVDPNGVKYDTFNAQTQTYGRYLLFASIAVLILEVYWFYTKVGG